jgi:hypothetical protein
MLSEAEIEERMLLMLELEFRQPERWYYLSFADETRPKGEQFLGAAVVKANGVLTATRKCHVLGINPGGQVLCVPLPEGQKPYPWDADRLLSKSTALNLEFCDE